MALTRLQDPESIVKDVDKLASEMERLRVLYEQYFLGIERLAPSKLRTSVSDLIRKYSGSAIQNARLKFKYQQLVARYGTYSTYWDRILREIEEGTYQRDVFKVNIGARDSKEQKKEQIAPPSIPSDPVAAVFDKYVALKKQCKEGVAGLTLDRFRAALAGQMDAVRKKTGCKNVKIDLVVEDGKTKIRATPVRVSPAPTRPGG